MRRIACGTLAFLVVGCSALGLDRIPIPVCETSEDCRLLNEERGIPDTACERYFCLGATSGRGTCQLGPEDFDGDGVARCLTPVVDCDDHDETVYPNAEEVGCDGIDQDCDGVVDEGAFARAPTVAVASLGEVDSVSFAPGASGVSAIAWTDSSHAATVAALGAAASGAPNALAYRANSRGSSAATDGIRTPTLVADAAGCLTRAPSGVSCPGPGATCDGPGADGLPWLADLPGDGHFCVAGVCDACAVDSDCRPNTLPRTCNHTDDASSCSPRPVAAAPELSPAHCCAGQVLDTNTTPSIGGDPAACCADLPRMCRAGVCRDSCGRDEDCPMVAFQRSVTRPIFGICVEGSCVPPDRPDIDGPAVASCNFDDVALDRLESNPVWVVASLNARGCAGGQLRLGISTGETPSDVLALGPESRSDVFAGVDVDVISGGCTGASRGDSIRGAAQPEISVAAGDVSGRGTGLVVYLARPASGLSSCGSTSAFDVEALGMYFAPAIATEAGYVHASNDGVPITLGRTAGVGRPSIIALSEGGWLVGFGSPSTAGVDLRVVRPLDPLPVLSPPCTSTADCTGGASCVGAGAGTAGACRLPCTGRDGCSSDAFTCCVSPSGCRLTEVGFCVASNRGHVSRRTTSLALVGAASTLTTADVADHVQMASGTVGGELARVGIVWQTGCDASARVWFASAQLDLAVGAIVGRTEAIAIGDGSRPAVEYVEDGVLVPGRVRPTGAVIADETNDGGFVVAWTSTDGHLLAVRVAELGDLVVDEPPLQLDDASRRVGVRVGHLFSSTSSGSRLEYAYAESGAGAAVLGGTLSCRAAR